MRRLAAPLALATLACGFAACGETDRPPDEVVREYVEAFDRADGDRACGSLVTDGFLRNTAGGGEVPVERARRVCLEQLRALEAEEVEVVLIPEIEERGDVARVVIRLRIGDDRPRRRITLRRLDGEWKIDEVLQL
jgi:hypothetical protein